MGLGLGSKENLMCKQHLKALGLISGIPITGLVQKPHNSSSPQVTWLRASCLEKQITTSLERN